MELIKQIEINIDYILELVKKYHKDHTKNREVLVDIEKAIHSSMALRNKRELIMAFIATLDSVSMIDEAWRVFVEQRKKEELDEIITQENLDKDKTYSFMESAFKNGFVQETGTDLSAILPPVSRFNSVGERTKKREQVLNRLKEYFDRYFDISKPTITL